MTDVQTRLRAMFVHVAGTDGVPPFPHVASDPPHAAPAATSEPSRPRRARRRTLAGAAALAIAGGGLSVAAAAGLPVLPSSVLQALGWAPVAGAYNADPSTARELLTVPGPGGIPLQLWFADASNNGYCVSLSFVRRGRSGFDADPAAQPANGVGAGSCAGPLGGTYWHKFGGDVTTARNSESFTFIVHVPGAATSRLQFSDGSSRPVPVGGGWTAGWLTDHDARLRPVLVGLAEDGTRVGTVALT